MRDDYGRSEGEQVCSETGRGDGLPDGYALLETRQDELAEGSAGGGNEARAVGGEDAERGGWAEGPNETKGERLARKREETRRGPHVLYRFYSPAGKLLYVGITANLKQRAYGHRRSSTWFSGEVGVIIENYPSGYLAAEAELAAIITEQPLHNVAKRWAYGDHSPERARIVVLEEARWWATVENDRRSPNIAFHLRLSV